MYGIQKIQFPVKDSYNGINSTERGNRGHEQLLVGGSAAKFVTNSLEELLYEYTPNATSDEKVGNFVTAMENLAPVWRPVDYIEEYSSCREKYDVHLLNTYASELRHTGHMIMMEGDYVYALPPLQTLRTIYTEGSANLYKSGTNVFVHPFMINKQEMENFKQDYINARIYTENDFGNLSRNSMLTKKMTQDQLKNMTRLPKLEPLGQIIGKLDDYGEGCEVHPDDRFVIRWM